MQPNRWLELPIELRRHILLDLLLPNVYHLPPYKKYRSNNSLLEETSDAYSPNEPLAFRGEFDRLAGLIGAQTMAALACTCHTLYVAIAHDVWLWRTVAERVYGLAWEEWDWIDWQAVTLSLSPRRSRTITPTGCSGPASIVITDPVHLREQDWYTAFWARARLESHWRASRYRTRRINLPISTRSIDNVTILATCRWRTVLMLHPTRQLMVVSHTNAFAYTRLQPIAKVTGQVLLTQTPSGKHVPIPSVFELNTAGKLAGEKVKIFMDARHVVASWPSGWGKHTVFVWYPAAGGFTPVTTTATASPWIKNSDVVSLPPLNVPLLRDNTRYPAELRRGWLLIQHAMAAWQHHREFALLHLATGRCRTVSVPGRYATCHIQSLSEHVEEVEERGSVWPRIVTTIHVYCARLIDNTTNNNNHGSNSNNNNSNKKNSKSADHNAAINEPAQLEWELWAVPMIPMTLADQTAAAIATVESHQYHYNYNDKNRDNGKDSCNEKSTFKPAYDLSLPIVRRCRRRRGRYTAPVEMLNGEWHSCRLDRYNVRVEAQPPATHYRHYIAHSTVVPEQPLSIGCGPYRSHGLRDIPPRLLPVGQSRSVHFDLTYDGYQLSAAHDYRQPPSRIWRAIGSICFTHRPRSAHDVSAWTSEETAEPSPLIPTQTMLNTANNSEHQSHSWRFRSLGLRRRSRSSLTPVTTQPIALLPHATAPAAMLTINNRAVGDLNYRRQAASSSSTASLSSSSLLDRQYCLIDMAAGRALSDVRLPKRWPLLSTEQLAVCATQVCMVEETGTTFRLSILSYSNECERHRRWSADTAHNTAALKSKLGKRFISKTATPTFWHNVYDYIVRP
ncbi:hypothetical protein BDF19DRAFT_440049 [Syncephalis fuscata]|nr:hypothetical protein BDF19DRAFT_440049 [Syncephalis fuscata]